MIKVEFGALVRKYRKKKGLTQEQLSSASGVTWRYLQAIEAGDYHPSILTVFKLADALDILPSALLDALFRDWREQGRPEE